MKRNTFGFTFKRIYSNLLVSFSIISHLRCVQRFRTSMDSCDCLVYKSLYYGDVDNTIGEESKV